MHCYIKGKATVLQKKTEDGEYIVVGELKASDYFGEDLKVISTVCVCVLWSSTTLC